jgi:hypothetical protein
MTPAAAAQRGGRGQVRQPPPLRRQLVTQLACVPTDGASSKSQSRGHWRDNYNGARSRLSETSKGGRGPKQALAGASGSRALPPARHWACRAGQKAGSPPAASQTIAATHPLAGVCVCVWGLEPRAHGLREGGGCWSRNEHTHTHPRPSHGVEVSSWMALLSVTCRPSVSTFVCDCAIAIH